MELKLLRGNAIWIRSEHNEIFLVECTDDGDLKSQRTQPRDENT